MIMVDCIITELTGNPDWESMPFPLESTIKRVHAIKPVVDYNVPAPLDSPVFSLVHRDRIILSVIQFLGNINSRINLNNL